MDTRKYKSKKGEYGTVWFIGNKKVIKISKKTLNNEYVYEVPDLKEAIFYSSVGYKKSESHPYIGTCHEIRFDKSIELILSEYEPLDKNKISFMKFIKEAAITFKYLHSFDITHRDLKPQNILMGKNNSIRIIDWGLVGIGKKYSYHNGYFTLWYRPIEMLKGNKGNSIKGDIWSLAITLLSIYYDYDLFMDDIKTIPKMIVILNQMFDSKGEIAQGPTVKRLQYIFEGMTDKEATLLSGMLRYDPNERWSADDILKFIKYQPLLTKPTFIEWTGSPIDKSPHEYEKMQSCEVFNWLAGIAQNLLLNKRTFISSMIITKSYIAKVKQFYSARDILFTKNAHCESGRNLRLIGISALFIGAVIYDSLIPELGEWVNTIQYIFTINNMMYQVKNIVTVERGQLIFDLPIHLIRHESMSINNSRNTDKNFYYLFMLLNLDYVMDYHTCVKMNKIPQKIIDKINKLSKKKCFKSFVEKYKS